MSKMGTDLVVGRWAGDLMGLRNAKFIWGDDMEEWFGNPGVIWRMV